MSFDEFTYRKWRLWRQPLWLVRQELAIDGFSLTEPGTFLHCEAAFGDAGSGLFSPPTPPWAIPGKKEKKLVKNQLFTVFIR